MTELGGGIRGPRESYAATRDEDARSAFESDRGVSLDDYSSDAKPRVFISFHIEDEAQVNLLRHQARNSDQLEFTDYSVKEPFTEEWKRRCEERLKQSSVVVVAIGAETHSRPAVLWEINKAHELGKPVIGMRIHGDKNHKIPQPMVDHGDRVVPWSLDALNNELDKARRPENGSTR